jgi:hypothetical protein
MEEITKEGLLGGLGAMKAAISHMDHCGKDTVSREELLQVIALAEADLDRRFSKIIKLK